MPSWDAVAFCWGPREAFQIRVAQSTLVLRGPRPQPLVTSCDCRAGNAAHKFAPLAHPSGTVCNVHACNSTTHAKREAEPQKYKGHLQALGMQGQLTTAVPELRHCPDGPSFMENYVYRNRPVVLRGCARHAAEKWADSAFIKQLATSLDWDPIVEHQKNVIQNDRGPASVMPFTEFVERSKREPFYLVAAPHEGKLRRQPQTSRVKMVLARLNTMLRVHTGAESSRRAATLLVLQGYASTCPFRTSLRARVHYKLSAAATCG